MPANTSQPLSRFKVLDLTRARSGPTCVRQLADWGADVTMIEMPDESQNIMGERTDPDFQNLHRNKRSMTLDLKQPEGAALFKRMVAGTDVVVENFRPDVKFRLGIDYESLRTINPRLIYGSISGFGQDGPYEDRPGFDQIAQGMGGLMSITGLPGQGPVRVGIPIADLSAGIFCAMGILLALIERETSGEGQWVRSSLLQAQIALLDFQAARWLIAGEVPGQAGNDHPTLAPTGVFPTSDGHINIAASGSHIFKRLLEAIGAEDLAADPRYANVKLRAANRPALHKSIGDLTSQKTSADWIERLNAAGVPCGPIYGMDEVFADPQVRHLKMATPMKRPIHGDTHVVNQAVELMRTPSSIRSPTPEKGEHTDAILRELGCGDAEIAGLHERNVV